MTTRLSPAPAGSRKPPSPIGGAPPPGRGAPPPGRGAPPPGRGAPPPAGAHRRRPGRTAARRGRQLSDGPPGAGTDDTSLAACPAPFPAPAALPRQPGIRVGSRSPAFFAASASAGLRCCTLSLSLDVAVFASPVACATAVPAACCTAGLSAALRASLFICSYRSRPARVPTTKPAARPARKVTRYRMWHLFPLSAPAFVHFPI